MRYAEYKANFDAKLAALKFSDETRLVGVGCETKMRPAMPPWIMDKAILYGDGNHIRVKETYKAQVHPNFEHGERRHFCFQYGATTGIDAKGMPRTASDRDTVIRLDCDNFGPHIHYKGLGHIKQDDIVGSLIIGQVEVFEFIEAIETHRQSKCSIEEVFFFDLKRRKGNR
ncbi:MAG: hypothetical protein WBY53_03285 [Acidobacteriaceae bacterium]